MNDEERICLAKTEFREAYNSGNVQRLLSVFADWGGSELTAASVVR